MSGLNASPRQATVGERKLRRGLGHLADHPVGLAVVHLAGGADHARQVRRGVHDEPRIDGDAVAADAGAGLQDLHPRMVVGELDQLPDVDAEPVADERQLVGERDVHVAEGVLRQLGHLGGARVRLQALALHEQAVEGHRELRAARAHAADHAVVLDELAQHVAGQHALGAIGDADVGLLARLLGEGEVRPRLGEPSGHAVRRADGRGRLQDDQVALGEHRGDAARRRLDVGEVRLVVVLERRRHRDHEDVGGLGHEGRAEGARAHGPAHEGVELGLDDVDAAAVDHLDDARVDVDADHLHAAAGDDGRGRQADVAQPDDRHPGKRHFHDGRSLSAILCAALPSP